MIKVEYINTWGFEHAIRGMRNPMNSWDKSDTYKEYDPNNIINIGQNDAILMKKLYQAGPEHRKFMRQIFISLDITAPLYWWKEFDTYKVGTVSNSCSTMHKITSKEFTLDDFSYDKLNKESISCLKDIIVILNKYRDKFNDEKEKQYWWQIIQLLPSSYNQKRTITMNYENAANIAHQRNEHKLDEWNELCKIFIKELPYFKYLISNAVVF